MLPWLSSPSSFVFDRGSLEPLFRSFCATAREASYEPLDEASLKLEAGDDAAWQAWEADERFLAERTIENDATAGADAEVLAMENALARGCSERVRIRIAATTSSADILDRLASDPRWRVREEVAKRSQLLSEATMRRLVRDEDPAPRWQLARAAHTPPAILRGLAADSSREVLIALASHPTPASSSSAEHAEIFAILARAREVEVRRTVATREKPPSALAEDAEVTVRVLLAGNRGSDRSVLERLARDKSSIVRIAVATSTIHPEILASLFSDPELEVRASVAANEHTPTDLVRALATDANDDIRAGVAMNPRAPASIIETLAADSARNVRLRTLLRPDAPPERFDRLASDPDTSVRFRLARDIRTPPATLARLARDSCDSVRSGVAENPSTLQDSVVELANDDQLAVRQAVERRRLKKTKMMMNVAEPPSEPRMPPATIENILREARRRDPYNRARVAWDPRTPDPILLVLSKDQNKYVCGSLAGNVAADSAIVEELLWRRRYLDEVPRNPNGPFRLRIFPRVPRTTFEEVDD